MNLGKPNLLIFLAIFLGFLLPVRGQTGRSIKYFTGERSEQVISDNGSIIINYRIPEINLDNITNENGAFFRLSIPGHVSSSETGKPELPVYSKLIVIPEGSSFKIRISEVRTDRIRTPGKEKRVLFPAQETEIKSAGGKRHFVIDKTIYSRRSLFGFDTVRVVPAGKARNSLLANLYISPVRYNPAANTLEVIKSMKVEIIFTDHLSAKSFDDKSAAFRESLSISTLNFANETVPGFSTKPVGMIIVTDTSFKKQIKPLIQWKTEKGFRLQVLYMGKKFAGVTWSQLKDTLTKIYQSATPDKPAAEYLLIIGDVNHVPYYGSGGSGNITDMYYGEYDGNGDYIPEMYVGRLPAADTNEVKAGIEKIIQYEKFQFTPSNKFHSRALVTAGSDESYANYMNGQIKYSVRNYLIKENNLNEYHFYYPQPDLRIQKDSIIKLINYGMCLINYTGHGDVSGWQHIDIKVADSSKFTNRNMYPLIISNACRTSQFSNSAAFGNRLVVSRNKGAIGFIGCSNDSYWDEDYYWAVGVGTITANPDYSTKGPGIYDRLFHTHSESPSGWYYTLGQINYAGNLSVSASTSARKKYYWETYNVVGDPSIIPILGTPGTFDVQLPDTLPNGIKSLSLQIPPFSYIAISGRDTLWDASFASASGTVTLSLPGKKNDSCLVVLTGQNRLPLIKKIKISVVRKEFLSLNSSKINDAPGNNNNKADFGESFFLNLSISNMGLTDAKNVYAKISSRSGLMTIDQDSAYIGTLPVGGTYDLSDKLHLRVQQNVPDQGIATISLKVKDSFIEKNYLIDVVVHAPVLKILSCYPDDTENGNGDHIADPGESFKLVFSVRNDGSSDASGTLNISSETSGFEVLQPAVSSGILKSGQSTQIPVMVRLSSTSSSGSYVNLNSALSCDPYVINKDFTFRVGKVRESFEASSFDIFPWINTSAIPWQITSGSSFDGSFSAKSGPILNNGSTSLILKTYYPQADTLKFYYRVSSEANYDFFSFILNGKEILRKSGEVSWTKASIPVSAGLNRLEWVYRKDQSVNSGSDCAWIDMIDFAGSGSVSYIKRDLELARIIPPSGKEHYGLENLTVKVCNKGRDVLDGFNLGFMLNDKGPVVKQLFDNKLLPDGDTATVTFKTRLDLFKYGIYKITAFGTDNSDDYLLNDTLKAEVDNTHMTENFSVFPNPYRDYFTIFIKSDRNDHVVITVQNIAGTILYSTERELISGQNTITINDCKLIPSLYYVRIKGTFTLKTVPLVRAIK